MSFPAKSFSQTKEYHFSYALFDYGLISVEPEKDDWDIEWTGAVSKTTSEGKEIPHYFTDQDGGTRGYPQITYALIN